MKIVVPQISVVEVLGDTTTPMANIDIIGELNCGSSSVILDGGPSTGQSLAFEWFDDNGNPISNDTSITVSIAGDYSLLLTNTINGCTSTTSIEVTGDASLPMVIATVNDTLNCIIEEISLDGNGSSEGANFEYEWQNSSGDSIANTLQTIIEQAGFYTLIVINTENGCSNSQTVEVIQDIETPIANAGEDMTIICNQTSVQLDGSNSNANSGSLTFEWTNSEGDLIGNSAFVEVDADGIYTLTVFAENGCSASDMVEVVLDANIPIADVGDGGTLDCSVTLISLGGNGSSSGVDITYQWLDENNTVISNASTTEVELPGTYTLIVTNSSNNCSASASIEIPQDVNLPVADAGNDGTLNCEVVEITLDGSQSSSGQDFQYQWLDANNDPISDQITTLIDQPGSYTLVVTNAHQ